MSLFFNNNINVTAVIEPGPGGSVPPLYLLSGATAAVSGSWVAIPYDSYPRSVETILTGTGAVSATVQVYGRNTSSTNAVLLLTFNMSGASGSDISASSIENPFAYLRADVTGISGTGASITVATAH